MTQIDRVLSALIGDKGNIRRIAFAESGRWYQCYVPEDSLWNAVKDNLLLAEYERAGIELKRIRGVVLDAGAHVGLFSLRASTHASRVVALEPHPANFALLGINLLTNGVESVEPRCAALWSSAGKVALTEGRHTAEASIGKSGRRAHGATAVTLHDIIEEIGAIDLLKLDIEGAEFSVLGSAPEDTLSKVGAIVGELHLDGNHERARSIANKLGSHGFDVTILRPPIYFWQQSMARVLRRWRTVENVTRLKLTVLATYTATAIVDAVVGLRRSTHLDDLMFLYATRRLG